MTKPWSISTTLRNPDRILPFLEVLKEIEGENFDKEGQVKYQTLLIQNRLYRPNGLDERLASFYETSEDKMSWTEAKQVFNHMVTNSSELRRDPGLRGRTSVAPLTKMGLAIARKSSGAVKITGLGEAFLSGKLDIGDLYLKFFMKWQFPNPESYDYKAEDGYDIKPFVGVLHLIKKVNEKSLASGDKEKGLSKKEFALFCPTLIDFSQIEDYANKIIELRSQQEGLRKREKEEVFNKYKEIFLSEFLGSDNQRDIDKISNNLKDYGDNAIRYFRLTRFLYIRGGGFYVDLEHRRNVEIKSLLSSDDASSCTFEDKDEYVKYMSDISQPEFPWETIPELRKIAESLSTNIEEYEASLGIEQSGCDSYQGQNNKQDLLRLIERMRSYRRELQEKTVHEEAQKVETIESCIEQLDNIYNAEDRPILLEKLLALGLNALNDAINIQPNYPVGDDNEPTFTAPANVPDIECFYEQFNAICEVTMLKSRDQWYNEGQPVMRHLRDFENTRPEKGAYCLFVAPKIHRDTLNTFWTAVKYEYEGEKQNIIPMTIKDFVELIKILRERKIHGTTISHEDVKSLYDHILNETRELGDSSLWPEKVSSCIKIWGSSLIQA